MSLDNRQITKFVALFTGHTGHYGRCVLLNDKRADGKRATKSYTEHGPVTTNLYREHLAGKTGLGIVPIDASGRCSFAVIDVDDYKTTPVDKVLKIVRAYTLPFNVFRTKSGGLHLYVFFSEPCPARDVREIMVQYMELLGLSDCELFPKQDVLAPGDSGNWINLPYFDYENTDRYLFAENGEPVDLEDALLYLENRRITMETLGKLYNALPLSDAPPCLQSLYISGNVTNRNIYLFDIATYLKAKFPSRWEHELIKINDTLADPLPVEEIEKTIIKSHKKNNYSYRCKEKDQKEHCNEGVCQARAYGHGTDNVSKFSFEKLVQVKTKEPYYIWTVNGQDLVFYNVDDIYDQHKFIKLCFEKLIGAPNAVPRNKWNKILNDAILNAEIREVDEDEDITPTQLVLNYTREFLLTKAKAPNREQILLGKVFHDDMESTYVFRIDSLLDFLRGNKNFRALSNTRIYHTLRTEAGAFNKPYRIRKDLVRKLWFIPYKFTDGYNEDVKLDIDFIDEIAKAKKDTGSEDY